MQVSSEHEIEMEEEDEEELHLPNELLTVRDGNRRLMQDIDCGGLRSSRCSVHLRPNLCNRACGTCCVRCKCVPPGTSGNRELCGACYTDMTTHDLHKKNKSSNNQQSAATFLHTNHNLQKKRTKPEQICNFEPIVIKNAQMPLGPTSIFMHRSERIPGTAITKSVVTNKPVGRKRDEIFVDVIEKISVTFNSSGYILTSEIDGTIQMKSYLTGNLEIRLALNEDLSIGASDCGGSGVVI